MIYSTTHRTHSLCINATFVKWSVKKKLDFVLEIVKYHYRDEMKQNYKQGNNNCNQGSQSESSWNNTHTPTLTPPQVY